MAIQYWDSVGGDWTDIPAAAMTGTYGGSCAVVYPPPSANGSHGRPLAIGNPTIEIRTDWMTDSGMNFWRDLIGSTTAESSVEDFSVWDMRSETQLKLTGNLHWPTWSSVSRGSAVTNTVYHNVRIIVTDCTTSSHP